MADEPESPILHMLRRIDPSVSGTREALRDPQMPPTHHGDGIAGSNRRMDRFEVRLDRIERRLELTDAAL